VPVNLDPKLAEPPSVMALTDVKLPQLAQLGDSVSAVQGPPSNGPGSGGGLETTAAVAWVQVEGMALGLTMTAMFTGGAAAA